MKFLLLLLLLTHSVFSTTSDDGLFTITKTIDADTVALGEPVVVTLNITTKATPDDVENSNRDVVLLFDVSNSMQNRIDGIQKMDAAIEAGQAFVRSMKPGKRVAIWLLGTRTTKVEKLLSFTSDTTTLIETITDISYEGATPLFQGVLSALRYAKDSSINKPPVMVVLADGDADDNGNQALDSLAYYHENMGMETYAIGLGVDNTAELESIASAGGGKYFDSPSPRELKNIFVEIAESIEETAIVSNDFQGEPLPLLNDIIPGYITVKNDSAWATTNNNVRKWSYEIDQVRSSITGESLTRLRFDIPTLKYGDVFEVQYTMIYNKSGVLSVDLSSDDDPLSYSKVSYLPNDSNAINTILPFSLNKTIVVVSKMYGISFVAPPEGYVDNFLDAVIMADVGNETFFSGYTNTEEIILECPNNVEIEYNGTTYTGELIIPKGAMTNGVIPIRVTSNVEGTTYFETSNSEELSINKIDYDTITWTPLTNLYSTVVTKASWDSSLTIVDTTERINALRELSIKDTDTLDWFLTDSIRLYFVGIDTIENEYTLVDATWSATGTEKNSKFWYPVPLKTTGQFDSYVGINDVAALGHVSISLTSHIGTTAINVRIKDTLSNFYITFPETDDTIYYNTTEVDTIRSSFYTASKKLFYAHTSVNGELERVKLYWSVSDLQNVEIIDSILGNESSVFFNQAEDIVYTVTRNGLSKSFVLKLENKLEAGIYPNPLKLSALTPETSDIFIVDIEQVGYIKAIIYDIHGNMIRTFEGFSKNDGDFETSTQSLKNKLAVKYSLKSWDGTNSDGIPLNSGVYHLYFFIDVKTEDGTIESKVHNVSFYYIKD